MGRLTILAKETMVYGMSSIFGRLLNWLLVPLYTQFLPPDQYGIVTELYAYAAFFVILYTYGMETAYFRFATKNKISEYSTYNLAQTAILISSLLFSLILILAATPVINFLDYPGKENYIIWFALILAFDAIISIPFARLRLAGKARRFAIAKITNILINVGLNLFFIVFCLNIMNGKIFPHLSGLIDIFFDKTRLVDYIFLSNLIANAFLVLLIGDQMLKFRIRFNWKELKPILNYAYPLLIMGLAGVTNEMLSRAMLKKWLPQDFYPDYSNQAALGIFGAVYKLSVFMTLAIQAFRYAAEPFFFSKANQTDSKELFSRVLNWFIIFGCLVFMAVSLNIDIIGLFFLRSPVYRDGLSVVPVLLMANLFLGIYYNLSVWFKLTDKTYFGTIISTGGALITIVLNILLIPHFGYAGSSWVTLICYFLISMASYLIGQRYYPIPYEVLKAFIFIILSSILVFIGNERVSQSMVIQKLFQFTLILVFIGLVYIFEKKQIRSYLNKSV